MTTWGSGLWSLRQLPCDYRALVRISLAFSKRIEVPFRKWGNTKNPSNFHYHHRLPSPTLRETQMSFSRHAFLLRFLTSLPHLKFYRSYWQHPAGSECFSNIRDWILWHDKCNADKSCSLFTSRFQILCTQQEIRYIMASIIRFLE